MTQREAQYFVQGIQFASAAPCIDDEQCIALTVLALEVMQALNVNAMEMITLTPDIHRSLDAGGFRGPEAKVRANQ